MGELIGSEGIRNLPTREFPKVHDRASEAFPLVAVCRVNHLTIVLRHNVHAGFFRLAARDKEARPRLRDFKCCRRQRAGPLVVLLHFKAANPILADVVALHVRSPGGHRVPFDGLFVESGSGSRPVGERAALKTEIQRLSVGPNGQNGSLRKNRDRTGE